MPDFFDHTNKEYTLFNKPLFALQKARSLDGVGNTLYSRGLTLHLPSSFLTFAAVKNETHNKGWTLDGDDTTFHRFLINPFTGTYFIGSYAFGFMLRKSIKKIGGNNMTNITWTDAIEGGFTEADFKLFSDLFEVRATSSQIERISFSQRGFAFEDPQPNGPVEDIHFSQKVFHRNTGNTTYDHLATFLNVSDFEEVCLSLCSLAKKHQFNVDKMIEDMEDHPEEYSCNEVLISN